MQAMNSSNNVFWINEHCPTPKLGYLPKSNICWVFKETNKFWIILKENSKPPSNYLCFSLSSSIFIVVSYFTNCRLVKKSEKLAQKITVLGTTLEFVGNLRNSFQWINTGLLRSLEYIQIVIWRNNPKKAPHWTSHKLAAFDFHCWEPAVLQHSLIHN